MTNLRELIEQINKLTEDEFVDEFNTEVTNADFSAPQENNTTQELKAKTKVSRALDILKEAIDDFKNIVVEELDLIADAALSSSIESLDEIVIAIDSILAGESKEVEFEKIEEPEEFEEEPEEDFEMDSEESENDNEETSEDEDAEVNFDDEAELDLFAEEE